MLNFLFTGCLMLPMLFPMRTGFKNEPTRADPVPKGYEIAARFAVGSQEHVIFRNLRLRKYRVYVSGKFDCEKQMEKPSCCEPVDNQTP